MSNESILIMGFVAALSWAYWMQVKYNAQVLLNDTLVGIIRKQEAQIEEFKDAVTQYKKADAEMGKLIFQSSSVLVIDKTQKP